jgi:hypothetical protein
VGLLLSYSSLAVKARAHMHKGWDTFWWLPSTRRAPLVLALLIVLITLSHGCKRLQYVERFFALDLLINVYCLFRGRSA